VNPPLDDPFHSLLAFGVIAPEASTYVSLVVLLVLLICSALISGSEVAYFSLSPADMRVIEEVPDATNSRINDLLSRPSRLLATILICNNLVNIAIVVLSAFILGNLFVFSPENELIQLSWKW
jgi:putative hemolysin